MNFKTIAIGLALIASLSLPAHAQTSRPADVPTSEPHEFNEKVPTKFDGSIKSLKATKDIEFKVYQSGPEDSKKAILLIHEWWGLNAHIKGLADQFGKLGYRCYAIDLYDGKVAKTAKDAGSYMKNVDEKKAQAKLGAAIADLAKGGRKIGTIGWCFGGGWSLRASIANNKSVAATVIYYGRLVTSLDSLKKLKSPVLGIFAKRDGWIKADQVKAFEAALNKAGVKNSIHLYDADHAFANPSGNRFKKAPAQDAWKKTLEFFANNLK